MSGSDFASQFDTASLAELVRLAGFPVLLDSALTGALAEGSGLLVTSAQANTWEVFDNPTGALAESIYPYVASPSSLEIRVGVPYGRRREFGFSGMTDSLGRYFANDPAKPYLQPAIESNLSPVSQLVADAVEAVWQQIGRRP